MTSTYKILGQLQTTADQGAAVYVVPTGKQAAISNVSIVNTGTSAASYSMFAVPQSEYASTLVPTAYDWIQTSRIVGTSDPSDTNFGTVVALSRDGTMLLASNPYNDYSETDPDFGIVKLYQWNGTSWVYKAFAYGQQADDRVGFETHTIAISDNNLTPPIVAVLSQLGRVYVYEYLAEYNFFSQKGSTIDVVDVSNFTERRIVLSGDGLVLAVSDYRLSSDTGRVRIYTWDAGSSSWIQRGSDIIGTSTNDETGRGLALSSDSLTLVVSSPQGNSGGAGFVQVFDWNGSSWIQRGSNIVGSAAYQSIGKEVKLSSDKQTIAVSVQSEGVNVYDWNGSSWIQRGSTLGVNDVYDQFGSSIALSGDGLVVSVAGPTRDVEGVGADAGEVRTYKWDGSAWTQLGSFLTGDAPNQRFGSSIAISEDGSRLISSAPLALSNAGYVESFELQVSATASEPALKHTLIKSKSITSGQLHDLTGGLTLSAGDVVVAKSDSNDVVISMFGAEIV